MSVECVKHLKRLSIDPMKACHCWNTLKTASNARAVNSVLTHSTRTVYGQPYVGKASLPKIRVSLAQLQQTMLMQTQPNKKTQLVESIRGADSQLTFAEKGNSFVTNEQLIFIIIVIIISDEINVMQYKISY